MVTELPGLAGAVHDSIVYTQAYRSAMARTGTARGVLFRTTRGQPRRCNPRCSTLTEIVIDADNNVWFDAVKMLVLNVRPALAVFANCLAGRIHENVDGEPLGLVSLQMMRGTRQVLACLAPVPDFFTPPLIGLFWQAYRSAPDVPDARAALAEAKASLASGDWPPGLKRKSVRPTGRQCWRC